MRIAPDACVLIYMVEKLGLAVEFIQFCKMHGIKVAESIIAEVCLGDTNGNMDWLGEFAIDDPELPDAWKPELPSALSHQDRLVIQTALLHDLEVLTNDTNVAKHAVRHGARVMGPRRVLAEMHEQGLIDGPTHSNCDRDLLKLLNQD